MTPISTTERAAGHMVTVKAKGAGEVVSITIDPRAIDPELLADLVLPPSTRRSGRGLMESKVSGLMPGGLGDLGALSPGAWRAGTTTGRIAPARSSCVELQA